MDILRWISLLLHTIQGTFGIVANGILIFLVLKRTPKQISIYSILILNIAICDIVSCAAALFVQQRAIASGFGIFFVSHGLCKFSGTVSCFIGYSLLMHCYSHGLWSLLFSFSYRYYILNHRQPKSSTVILIIILIYLPSLFQFLGHTAENREHSVRILRYSSKSSYAYLLRACIILIASSAAISSTGFAAYVVKFDQETIATIAYCFANDSEAELRILVEAKFGYDVSTECVSGHISVLCWNVFPFLLHMTLPITPIYMVILVLRRLTAIKLKGEGTISKNSLRLQSQLLQALIVQAGLPLFFLVAVATFATELLNIYHHPILEYTTFMMFGFAPMLTPLTSLYFIGPYRAWILQTFLPHNKAVTVAQPRPSATLATISRSRQDAY